MKKDKKEIEQAFREARGVVIDHFPASEERTKALEKLYEAEFWALRALSVPDPVEAVP